MICPALPPNLPCATCKCFHNTRELPRDLGIDEGSGSFCLQHASCRPSRLH